MILLHENFFGITTANVTASFLSVNNSAQMQFGTAFSRWSSNSSAVSTIGLGSFIFSSHTDSSAIYTGLASAINPATATSPVLFLTLRYNTNRLINASVDPAGIVSITREPSTLLITGLIPNYIPTNWGYYEFGTVIHPSNGSVEFKYNGQTIISQSGLITQTGSNSVANNTGFQSVSTNPSPYSLRVTDWYVTNNVGSNPNTNGFLGDIRIFSTIPSSSGDVNNFTPSSGSNMVNMVDDGNSPDNDTTFVSASLSGSLDLYNTFPFTGSFSTLYGLGVKALARKTDPGNRNIQLVIKSGSNSSYSSTQSVSDNYRYFSAIYETNPNTSAPWGSLSEINGTQIGYTIL